MVCSVKSSKQQWMLSCCAPVHTRRWFYANYATIRVDFLALGRWTILAGSAPLNATSYTPANRGYSAWMPRFVRILCTSRAAIVP